LDNPNDLQESDTMPTMTIDDCIEFVNINGSSRLWGNRKVPSYVVEEFSNGWIPINYSFTRASADDPTYVLKVTGFDVTSLYSLGMKMKFTQNSATVWAVITKIELSGSDTLISVYCGNNYDVLDTGSYPITSPYYSMVKAPYGFPLSRDNWDLTAAIALGQASPIQNIWYAGGNITLPIGDWSLQINADCNWVTGGGGAGAYNGSIYLTLSTANNTESDSSSTRDMVGQVYEPAGYSWNWSGNLILIEDKIQTAKVVWYVNGKTANTGVGSIGASGDIIARFNYI
jgi:hypothetical protein